MEDDAKTSYKAALIHPFRKLSLARQFFFHSFQTVGTRQAASRILCPFQISRIQPSEMASQGNINTSGKGRSMADVRSYTALIAGNGKHVGPLPSNKFFNKRFLGNFKLPMSFSKPQPDGCYSTKVHYDKELPTEALADRLSKSRKMEKDLLGLDKRNVEQSYPGLL